MYNLNFYKIISFILFLISVIAVIKEYINYHYANETKMYNLLYEIFNNKKYDKKCDSCKLAIYYKYIKFSSKYKKYILTKIGIDFLLTYKPYIFNYISLLSLLMAFINLISTLF